jgi:hypothetical protein
MSELKYLGAPKLERWLAGEEAISRGRLMELRETLYGITAQQMFEVAHLRPGDKTLDIAASMGDQSLLTARLVRLDGRGVWQQHHCKRSTCGSRSF